MCPPTSSAVLLDLPNRVEELGNNEGGQLVALPMTTPIRLVWNLTFVHGYQGTLVNIVNEARFVVCS
jgi:hypothetical protein